MAKSLVYIQEIYQLSNQFSIRYMINPRLNITRIFKDQVNICMKKIFNVTEQKHITKILTQENTRVLALLWFMTQIQKSLRNFQSVELCNLYNTWKLCLY